MKGQYKTIYHTGHYFAGTEQGPLCTFFPLICEITLKDEEAEVNSLGDFFNYCTSKQRRCSCSYIVSRPETPNKTLKFWEN